MAYLDDSLEEAAERWHGGGLEPCRRDGLEAAPVAAVHGPQSIVALRRFLVQVAQRGCIQHLGPAPTNIGFFKRQKPS